MEILRVILFIGLIFHKLLWEVLKKRGRARETSQKTSKMLYARFVKVFKGMILLFLCFQTLFLDLFPLSDQPSLLRVIGTAIYVVGLTTAVIGRLQLGKNWVDIEDSQVLPLQALVINGIYKYIRHPIYTGDLLLLIGLELALNSWLVLSIFILIPIVIRQALVEEAMLSKVFSNYHVYRMQTKRFIPFVL